MGKEKISLFVTVLVAIGTLVFALYYWLTELQVNWYALFICSIALHYLFKSLASHSVEGDTEEKEDLEKHVLKQVPMLHIMYSLYSFWLVFRIGRV